MRTRAWVLVLASWPACGRPPAAPDASVDLCTDQTPLAPTFANVQRLLSGTCTTCHGAMVELDLEASVSYGNLVGKPPPNYADPPTDESCGTVLVKPGDPVGSYLFQKVSVDMPCAGSRMPLTDVGTTSPLVPCAQVLIHDWIAAGAPND
jgi:hypothetical protein